MAGEPDPAGPGRLPLAALALAVAALLACWNPLAAPLGILVGASATALAIAAARRGPNRGVALLAALLGASAFVVSAAILGFSTGLIGGEPSGEPVAPERRPEETRALLDAAAERTRAARSRAAAELVGGEEGAPRPGRRDGSASPQAGGD